MATAAPAIPVNPHLPAAYVTELNALSSAGKLSGIPPQVLGFIMEAESGPSYEGGGWNGKAGGWFGLEPGDGGITQAQITSQSTFDQQAEIAASIYATGLQRANGNPIAAENYYQTGNLSSAANGAGIFESYGLQNLAGALTSIADAGGADTANPVPGPVGDALGLATGGSSLPGSEAAANGLTGGWAAFADDLLGGFGIGWKAVLTIIIGGLLIIVGLYVIFHKQVGQAAEVAAVA